jgi:hypothetical protein
MSEQDFMGDLANQEKAMQPHHFCSILNDDFIAAQNIFRKLSNLDRHDSEEMIQQMFSDEKGMRRHIVAVDTDHNGKPDTVIGVVEKGANGKDELVFDNPYNNLDKKYYPEGPKRK